MLITSKGKQDPSKSWLTPGITKSINIKSNLYKHFCQATNPAQKVSLHQTFKNYRNRTATKKPVKKI